MNKILLNSPNFLDNCTTPSNLITTFSLSDTAVEETLLPD